MPGTLPPINPKTSEVDYKYQQNSGIQKSGSSADHDVVDKFIITQAGDKNSQLGMDLHIHAQSVHGHSGHHIDETALTGMDIVAIASHDQHDDALADEDQNAIDAACIVSLSAEDKTEHADDHDQSAEHADYVPPTKSLH